jgi:hypothetical protein
MCAGCMLIKLMLTLDYMEIHNRTLSAELTVE